MAGLQTVIDNATFMTINARPITGSSISRAGQYKTSERGPSPYTISFGMHNGLTYSTNRDTLQALDNLDRTVEANISITNTAGMNYLTAYQGAAPSSELNGITMVSTTGSNIHINTNSITQDASKSLFKAGDYIQPQGDTGTYRYPYQVKVDVPLLSQAELVIQVNRPVLSQTGVALTSGGIRVGNDVRFNVKMANYPEYTIVPHDRIEFDGSFSLIEVII